MLMLEEPSVGNLNYFKCLYLWISGLEWHEFMNYMLVENNTLSSMKKEHFTYEKNDKIDKPPSMKELGHAKNITCMITIRPEDMEGPHKNHTGKTTLYEYKKKVKFVTGSSDGIVKVWAGMDLKYDFEL